MNSVEYALAFDQVIECGKNDIIERDPEFRRKAVDNTGATRPRYAANFTLREAIEQNNLSRIYLGVRCRSFPINFTINYSQNAEIDRRAKYWEYLL